MLFFNDLEFSAERDEGTFEENQKRNRSSEEGNLSLSLPNKAYIEVKNKKKQKKQKEKKKKRKIEVKNNSDVLVGI